MGTGETLISCCKQFPNSGCCCSWVNDWVLLPLSRKTIRAVWFALSAFIARLSYSQRLLIEPNLVRPKVLEKVFSNRSGITRILLVLVELLLSSRRLKP